MNARLLLLGAFLLNLSVSAAFAGTSCEAFSGYLDGENAVVDPGKCSTYERFLIENEALDPARTAMKLLHEFDQRQTILTQTLLGMENVIGGNFASAFTWLDFAETQIFAAFVKAEDLERAVSYGTLIGRTKYLALEPLLADKSSLLVDEARLPIFKQIGEAFKTLDRKRADFVLLCLIKSDNVFGRFEDVVASKRFKGCVDRYGAEEFY